MRFVFSPPAEQAAGLLNLPWNEPLEDWKDDRLTEIPQRGISRHVVRFIAEDGEVFALKEIPERLARREYSMLRRIGQMGIPAVEVLGVVVDRPDDLDAILVTRFLDFSSSFRALFANPAAAHLTDRLHGRAGGAARAAASGRGLLGRLLAVEHAVPLRRRGAGCLPGRLRDRRDPRAALRRPAPLRPRHRLREGRRRADGPAGGGSAAPRTSTRSRQPRTSSTATPRCGRSSPTRR